MYQTVTEDYLGAVIPTNPKPAFVRVNAEGNASLSADSFIADLAATVDSYRFTSTKAELAARLYAINHFVGHAPARFLLLFVALEALFDNLPRSSQAQNHINLLIAATTTAWGSLTTSSGPFAPHFPF